MNDFKMLERLLSIAGQNSIPCLYSVINNYTSFLGAGKGILINTNQGARAFEAAFDTLVLGNCTQRIGEIAQEYKRSLQKHAGNVMTEFDSAFQDQISTWYLSWTIILQTGPRAVFR